jgi:hypothetical protein
MSIVGVTASSRRQVPNAPTIGTATDVGTDRAFNNGAAVVTFTQSPIGFEATSYTVTSSPGGFTASGTSSPLTVTGLQSNTAYTFTATATNFVGTGSASAASNSITATTVPQAPTIGTPTLATGQPYTGSANIGVVFTAGATGGKSITTFTATSSSTTVVSGATSPITVSETIGISRNYTVTATNANGTSLVSSASTFITPSSVPESAPTIGTLSNVTGIAYGSNPQFTLTFGAPTSTGGSAISSYKYSTDGGTTYIAAPSNTSPMTLTTQSTSGTPAFVAGTSYSVILKAVNANGDSPASASSNSRVAATIPSTPTFTLSSTGNTNITGTYSYNTGGQAVTSFSSAVSGTAATTAGTSPVGNTSGALTYTFSYVQGTQYSVSFSVTNPMGTATASSQSITPFAAVSPGTPASLSAAVANTTTVNLTYGAIAINGSALTAWQGSGTSTGDIVSSPAINLTYSGTPSAAGGTISVSGTFAAIQSYTFTLKARNAAGVSGGVTSNSVVPLPTITDNFNRSGATLGTTSSGSPWTTHSGAWSTNGSQGVSSSSGVASVSFGTGTATVTADVTNGYGVAWWVSGSGSYYSSYYQQYTYTYSTGNNYCTDCSYTNYSCNNSVGYSCSGVGNGNGLYYGGNCYTCSSGFTFDQSDGVCKACANGTITTTTYSCNNNIGYYCPSGGGLYSGTCRSCPNGGSLNFSNGQCEGCSAGAAICPSGTTEYNGSCYSCSSGTLYNNTLCQVVSGTTGNGVYSYAGSASTYTATISARSCTSADVSNYYSPCLYNGECLPEGSGSVCLRDCVNGGIQSSASSSTCYVCSGGTVNGPNPSTGSGSIASCYAEGTQTAYTYTNATVSSKTTPAAGTYPNCNYGVAVFPTTSYNASSEVIFGGTYPNCSFGFSSSTSTTTVSGGTYPNCNYGVSTSSATNQGQATITVSSGGTYPNCCCGSSSSNSTAAAVAGYPTCGCLANTASRTNTGGGVAVTPTATATGDRVVTNGSASALLASAPTRLTAVTSAAGSWTVYAYNSSGTQIYTTTGSGTPAGNYGIFLGTSTLSLGTGVDNFSVS